MSSEEPRSSVRRAVEQGKTGRVLLTPAVLFSLLYARQAPPALAADSDGVSRKRPKPCRAHSSTVCRACRDQGEQRRAIRPFRAPHMPMAHSLRAARADPRVHLPMRRRRSWSCSSTPASPAGGAGTAWPRPSEREPEVIFVVLSVRSRRAVGTHVSPAMWQPIFFTNDGAALHLCLPVLACERAC